MPRTATVTGRVSDLSTNARPDWEPLVLVAPDRAAVTLDGTVVPTEPVVLEDDGAGNLSAYLIVSSEFVGPVRYTLTIDWLSIDGGTAARERLPDFVVPDTGGDLGGLTPTPRGSGVVWEGSTPPPTSGLWLYIEPTYDPASGDPLPTYTTDNDTIITHGDLVEWEA